MKSPQASQRRAAALVLASLLGAAGLSAGAEEPTTGKAVDSASQADAPALTVSVDGGGLVWSIPREERLEYEVEVDMGVLGRPDVGKLVIESGVKPFRAGVLVPSPKMAGEQLEMGWVRARASGESMVYTLDELIETSWLPQDFPRLYYRSTQTGSEHRRRQLKIGVQDAQPGSWYRADRHCKGCKNREHYLEPNWAWQDEHHCEKCKRGEHRIWRDPTTREVGPRAVDMLSAVLIMRAMIESGAQSVEFQVLDKSDLWDVTIRRGAQQTIEVPAGKFRAVPLVLTTSVPEGELEDHDDKFSALFGLSGSIQIWVEQSSGVPILILGDIPAGPLSFGVRASLKEFSGTPVAPVRVDD